MNGSFAPIGRNQAGIGGENSFWPSFTDIMMVITMIFLMATSLLVVRNWQLVAELQESITAEQVASRIIESTSVENATLEERLANAEQSNSILRLRVMKKEEELSRARTAMSQQESEITSLDLRYSDLRKSLEQANARLAVANLEVDAATAQNQELSNQINHLKEILAKNKLDSDLATAKLKNTRRQIVALTESSAVQKQNINQLTLAKSLLDKEVAAYNQQLLSLKGDYETVKSKYEKLIKPARTARGKYIAEVYYVRDKSGDVIRYRQPGDTEFTTMSLAKVEENLAQLKKTHNKDLYVKIIIPENSGLTYNEAWDFMRSLLVKYDYYYRE